MINYRTGVAEMAVTAFDPESEEFHNSLSYLREPTAKQVEQAWTWPGMVPIAGLRGGLRSPVHGNEVVPPFKFFVTGRGRSASELSYVAPQAQEWVPTTFAEALQLWHFESASESNHGDINYSWVARTRNWILGGELNSRMHPMWIADLRAIGFPQKVYSPDAGEATGSPEENPLARKLLGAAWRVMDSHPLQASVLRNPFVQVGAGTRVFSQVSCTRFDEAGDLVSTPPTVTIQMMRGDGPLLDITYGEWAKGQAKALARGFAISSRNLNQVKLHPFARECFRVVPASIPLTSGLTFKDLAAQAGVEAVLQEYRVLNLHSAGEKTVLSVLTWLNINPTSPVLMHYVFDAALSAERRIRAQSNDFVPVDCVQVSGVEDAFQTAQRTLTIAALRGAMEIYSTPQGSVGVHAFLGSSHRRSQMILGDFYSIVRTLGELCTSPQVRSRAFSWQNASLSGMSVPIPDVAGIIGRVIGERVANASPSSRDPSATSPTKVSALEILNLVFSTLVQPVPGVSGYPCTSYNPVFVRGEHISAVGTDPLVEPLFGTHLSGMYPQSTSYPISALAPEAFSGTNDGFSSISVPAELGLVSLVVRSGLQSLPEKDRPARLKELFEREFPEVSGAVILAMALGTLSDCLTPGTPTGSIDRYNPRLMSALRSKWVLVRHNQSRLAVLSGYALAGESTSHRSSARLYGPLHTNSGFEYDWASREAACAVEKKERLAREKIEAYAAAHPEEEVIDSVKILGRPEYFDKLGVPE